MDLSDVTLSNGELVASGIPCTWWKNENERPAVLSAGVTIPPGGYAIQLPDGAISVLTKAEFEITVRPPSGKKAKQTK